MLTFPTILPTEPVVFHIAEKVEGEYETEIIFHDFTVDGCVVAPTSAAELPEGFNLLERETITVHIPDSFTEDPVGGRFTVRGHEYEVLTSSFALTESPLVFRRNAVGVRIR